MSTRPRKKRVNAVAVSLNLAMDIAKVFETTVEDIFSFEDSKMDKHKK